MGSRGTRCGQRDIASLRVDIEIVWVFAAFFVGFFIFLFFVVDFYAAIRHKYFFCLPNDVCVCECATVCVKTKISHFVICFYKQH